MHINEYVSASSQRACTVTCFCKIGDYYVGTLRLCDRPRLLVNARHALKVSNYHPKAASTTSRNTSLSSWASCEKSIWRILVSSLRRDIVAISRWRLRYSFERIGHGWTERWQGGGDLSNAVCNKIFHEVHGEFVASSHEQLQKRFADMIKKAIRS